MKDYSNSNFSIAHCNLNRIAAQDFVKIIQLTTYKAMHNYDLISWAETWLDSTISSDSKDLALKGYNLNCFANSDDAKNDVIASTTNKP